MLPSLPVDASSALKNKIFEFNFLLSWNGTTLVACIYLKPIEGSIKKGNNIKLFYKSLEMFVRDKCHILLDHLKVMNERRC
jgi:hypothetical protein